MVDDNLNVTNRIDKGRANAAENTDKAAQKAQFKASLDGQRGAERKAQGAIDQGATGAQRQGRNAAAGDAAARAELRGGANTARFTAAGAQRAAKDAAQGAQGAGGVTGNNAAARGQQADATGGIQNFGALQGGNLKGNGAVLQKGYGDAALDKTLGADVNGSIGGGNGKRGTSQALLDNFGGPVRDNNLDRMDKAAYRQMLLSGNDPDQALTLRSSKVGANGKAEFTGYLTGPNDAIKAATQNGRINANELANQGNNNNDINSGHGGKNMSLMNATAAGSQVTMHNATFADIAANPGGKGFSGFVTQPNANGRHDGWVVGLVNDPLATSEADFKARNTLVNTAKSFSDLGNDGQVQAGSVAGQGLQNLLANNAIPGLGSNAGGAGAAHNH
jgi:hypothetical protein